MTTPKRNDPDELIIGLVSVSDRASQGVYEDKGIPSLQEWLGLALASPWRVETRLIQDDAPTISATLIELVDQAGCDLVLTTGAPVPRVATLRRKPPWPWPRSRCRALASRCARSA